MREVVTDVEMEFGVSHIVADMNKKLHHHDFSHETPKSILHKLKHEEQQVFNEYYNEELGSNGAPMLFMDTVHLTQSIKLSYGRSHQGQGKLIETTGNRSRVNLNGALSLKKDNSVTLESTERCYQKLF